MSYDLIEESVPPFVRRVGDYVAQGSNNSIIILGTDRVAKGPAAIDDGLGHPGAKNKGKGAGSAHVIVGRSGKGDPDLKNDSSTLYLSMLSEVDRNLGTDFEGDVGTVPCAIVRSTAVRLSARKDVKISIDGSDSYVLLREGEIVLRTEAGSVKMLRDRIVIDAGRVELGSNASERVILGDTFLRKFVLHTHPSAAGQTGPVIETFEDSAVLSQRAVFVS